MQASLTYSKLSCSSQCFVPRTLSWHGLTESAGVFRGLPCYAGGHSPSGGLRSYSSCQAAAQGVPAASFRKASSRPLATFASQPSTEQLQHTAVEHSVAATKASPAFLKTKNLFKDDMAYALEHAQSSSPQIAAGRQRSTDAAGQAQPSSPSSASAFPSQLTSIAWTGPHSRAPTASEDGSLADSVSSFHGYAGINYHPGMPMIFGQYAGALPLNMLSR